MPNNNSTHAFRLKVDTEISEEIADAHDAMKRVSDFIGAFLRLGALSVIILYTYRRGLPHDEWGFMFWDLSEWSMLLFLLFICILWAFLTTRILVFAFFLSTKRTTTAMRTYSPKDMPKSGRDLLGYFAYIKSQVFITITLISGTLMIVLLVLGSIAAIYEITIFLEGVQR